MTPAQTEDVGNGWKRIMSQSVALLPRKGWVGVWDSFVAAVTGHPIKTVPTNIFCSVYVKSVPDGHNLFSLQIEESPK